MRYSLDAAIPTLLLAGVLAALTGPVHAEVSLNAGVRLSHDNNVNGSPDRPSKANQLSDSFLSLSASAAYFKPLDAAQANYFIGQVGVQTSSYDKFNNLNSSMLAGSAGFYRQLSPTWSGQVMGRAFRRDTRQHERDSSGVGASLEIKKQLDPTLWIKGLADYEDNKANLDSFSYTGATYGVNLGYLPRPDTFVNLGYSHSGRDFKSVVTFTTTTQTLFVEVTERMSKNWYLSGGYAYMKNDSNFAGTAYTNQVLSLGVNFSY